MFCSTFKWLSIIFHIRNEFGSVVIDTVLHLKKYNVAKSTSDVTRTASLGKRYVTVWHMSVCLTVPSAYLL